QKSDLWAPAMGKESGVFREPGPIHPIEDEVAELRHRRVAKKLAAGQDSAQENCRIDRRHFGVEHAFAGFRIGKGVKESAMVGELLPQKAEGHENPLQNCGRRNEPTLRANAESCQSEARRCNRGGVTLPIDVNVAPIFNHPSSGTALIPKKLESCTLD